MLICNNLYILKLCVYSIVFARPSLQICLEEVTSNGLNVRWPESAEGTEVKSDPLCYNENTIITRDCVNSTWFPPAQHLPACLGALHMPDIRKSSLCPTSFTQVAENDTQYCYKIDNPTSWSFPCLEGGGASVITNLSDNYVESILSSLKEMNISRYFWLPGRRTKLFSQLIWNTPGQMWGRNVNSHKLLPLHDCIFKNCLLLDIVAREMISEVCWIEYPSLCLYRNNIHFPAKCPQNYHGVRFTPQESICAGIEVRSEKLTFEDFSNISRHQCTPMGDEIESGLSRYVYKEIAKNYALANDTWCWFSTSLYKHIGDDIGIFKTLFSDFRLSINQEGSIKINKKSDSEKLFCLACRTQVVYEQPELIFEYNEIDNKMYLTIYFPSGLWKYSENDTGFQCFSDAKGSVNVIEINRHPYMIARNIEFNEDTNFTVEKIVYRINPITDRSAQYWCEGHTNNFTLISTNKVIANPQGNDIHVFSLAIEVFLTDDEIRMELAEKMDEVCQNVTRIFNADKVLLMEMLTYDSEQLLVLLHLHMPLLNIEREKGENIKALYRHMRDIATTTLNKYYTFVNISSSMYCLPTVSNSDSAMTLEWELTAIGHIAAPKQFCLQANGLPVKRRCMGSYILGSKWGSVDGVCNKNYLPSRATTYLYQFYKGKMPENDTFEFLTNGLGYILNDIGIFIPADIYYLSISLQHILSMVHSNESSVNMGTIENIAWIMNRIMILDNQYLRLAQTLNSTNVILDAVGEIIHKLAAGNTFILFKNQNVGYNLARQPHFLIQICYPTFSNVSGIAVKYNHNSSDFLNVDIIPLYKNTTYEDVLSIPNLDIATWIPEKVLDSLISNSTYNETLKENEIRVIINIFLNDAVFQALDPTSFVLNSRVVGVSIPGFLPNLQHPIPLIFRNLHNLEYKKQCGYWDFTVNKNISGFWSNKGCYLVYLRNDTSVCNCYHLTHFGQLINVRERIIHDENSTSVINIRPLNIISLTGSFLSLLGIAGIWLTAFVFQAWRKKAGSKILLNLTAAIAMPLTIIIVFNLGDSIFRDDDGIYFASHKIKIQCIFFGAMLHYSVLASFMWMLITATLQFIRYVRVLGVYRPYRFMVKFTSVGWGIPIIPVASVLIFDRENYIPYSFISRNEFAICYPTGFYLIVTLIVPICIILFINIALFISVLYAISHGPDGKLRTTDIDLIGAQLRLSIFLFFLLGLTWIFGIFSFTKNLVWSYFFCLTSTLQGFVLFVYFIICDPITRNLWVNLMKPQFRSSSPRDSVTTISST